MDGIKGHEPQSRGEVEFGVARNVLLLRRANASYLLTRSVSRRESRLQPAIQCNAWPFVVLRCGPGGATGRLPVVQLHFRFPPR